MLQIYNSLTRKKEPFRPIEPGRVRMYVCGMTVYDYSHIGHARVLVVFDVVVRYLRASGYQVTYVRNITDIDDKILSRAREAGVEYTELTRRYIEAMREDAAALGVLRPDHEPCATEHIDGIESMIGVLLEKGHAYRAENHDVYFDVSRFPAYGRLSGERLEGLRAGARVEIGEAKDDPLDFVLWKAAKPGEPNWNTPWGCGRPGWHIECSAMSTAHLGPHFDIHGGGQDLRFPHHENEIAQSEAATGQPFVNYWMHAGFVRVNDEKMSKSLGNFFTIREVLARFPAEVIRFFLLSSHYRSPVHYGEDQLQTARLALGRLYTALRGLPSAYSAGCDEFEARFRAAMDDDFNTPEAIAVLFELAREINRVRDASPQQAAGLSAGLRALGAGLGLLHQDPDRFLQGVAPAADTALSETEIESLIEERAQARGRHDWAAADRVRDRLAAAAILLEDGPQGTTWRRG
ncbi:MAG: cysteine--tRNA ligase [Chromatiales bacterium 21-64-14]|nr:MAG: cysteine--tRNA ligase [Chromatiales bacterium 21-64-14]HQU15516.1 cysteine--tRNA ligase [Gammaproteobacteria bacterium]